MVKVGEKLKRTSLQVLQGEPVVDTVAGLSAPPTLQAGVFLLRRLQHVVTAQTLHKEDTQVLFDLYLYYS